MGASLVGALCVVVLLATTTLWFALLMPAALIKAVVPIPSLRRLLSRYITWIANSCWTTTNYWTMRLLHGDAPTVSIAHELDQRHSWLLICNHQSWTDILLLVEALRSLNAPFPRFFLKHQLLWVPIIGLGAWALDMPFMRRHTREQVAAKPSLALDDLCATRKACERYRGTPVTVVNFVEGTRFSVQKHQRSASPYTRLLKPKSGGVAFALAAMGDQFSGLLDATIIYRPSRRPLLWSFLCGEQVDAEIKLELRELPAEFMYGDYQNDEAFRQRFQGWIGELWCMKDKTVSRQ